MKKALLLVNLGTPDSPEPKDVRKYLDEFLMDPYVVDISPIARWLLVKLIILNTRPRKSAEAYQKVWTPEGSPLAVHHRALANKTWEALGPDWVVLSAMRYGNPSIRSAFEELARARNSAAETSNLIDELVIAPLYPQYSLAATESSIVECERWARALVPGLKVSFVPPFYNHPGFLDSFAAVAREPMREFNPDYVLFSFHGLPERQVVRTDSTGGAHCLKSDQCCAAIGAQNKNCYRAHSFATATGLAKRLNLPAEQYGVSFQSRLGRTPWIQPHTDVVVRELAAKGVRRLLVFSPSFVADCLETLEEIAIRAREDFKAQGGEELRLVPSLNSSELWVTTVVDLLGTRTDRALLT